MYVKSLNIWTRGCILVLWPFVSPACANSETSKMRDCTEVELEALIDQNASRDDNLARLSQQFFQSVNKIDYCDREPKNDGVVTSSPDSDSTSSNAETEETATANDENSGSDSTTIENTSNQGTNSSSVGTTTSQITTTSGVQYDTSSDTPTASGSLVGTNFEQNITEPATPSASDMAGNTTQPTTVGDHSSGAQKNEAEQDLRLTNGKTPDDIPDTENDSVFEAQIRAAAMAETDPDTKKNLWNEYRRYKGLPEQK